MNKFMTNSVKEAKKAFKKKEIPVGATIVYNNKIVASAHNDRQNKYKITGHAEINCILKAEKKLKDWRLDNCELYVTLEPCEMCKQVIKEARIKKVYYLVSKSSIYNNNEPNYIQTNVSNSMLAEYNNLLNSFFKDLRK